MEKWWLFFKLGDAGEELGCYLKFSFLNPGQEISEKKTQEPQTPPPSPAQGYSIGSWYSAPQYRTRNNGERPVRLTQSPHGCAGHDTRLGSVKAEMVHLCERGDARAVHHITTYSVLTSDTVKGSISFFRANMSALLSTSTILMVLLKAASALESQAYLKHHTHSPLIV